MAAKIPTTGAVRQLRKEKVSFTPRLYAYEEKGGTAVSARELGVDEARVVKTLIMERDDKKPLIVLMSGHLEVSTKNLARLIGVKTVVPCKPDVANKHSGYQVGGTSPFGVRKAMPVYMEKSVLDHETVFINGGKRGFLVEMSPADIQRILEAELVEIGV